MTAAIAPRKKQAPLKKWAKIPLLFALSPLPKSPSGRHSNSEGGVSPSENGSPTSLFFFTHITLPAPKNNQVTGRLTSWSTTSHTFFPEGWPPGQPPLTLFSRKVDLLVNHLSRFFSGRLTSWSTTSHTLFTYWKAKDKEKHRLILNDEDIVLPEKKARRAKS